jgi:hypothetical protein
VSSPDASSPGGTAEQPEPHREVKQMKKITVRKTGSIKLTSSAALYSPEGC